MHIMRPWVWSLGEAYKSTVGSACGWPMSLCIEANKVTRRKMLHSIILELDYCTGSKLHYTVTKGLHVNAV